MPHPLLDPHSTNHYKPQVPPDLPVSNPEIDAAVDTESWSFATHELLDALPRAWTRGILYFLVVFAAIALPWACLAKVDETGTARGRLEPEGGTVRLDAPVPGTVAAIEVQEGQTVQAEQPLMKLESDLVRADLQVAQSKLEGLHNRLDQLRSLQTQLTVTIQTQQLQNQAQAAAQQVQINQTQQQLEFNQAAARLAQELVAKDGDRLDRFRLLREQGVMSGLQVEDAERALIQSQQQLEKVQADIQQSQSELKKQQQTYQQTLRGGDLALLTTQKQMRELQTQVTDVTAEIAQTQEQIQSLRFQLQQRELRAPIAGTIFQLPIKDAGAVVQPGTEIAQIAAQNTPLILRAEMTSPESGFLHVGMPVKIKFDAYPFQDYGVMSGQLTWISPDSKIKQTPQGDIEVFELKIAIAHPYLPTATRNITLLPGQTATAEVIVRQRRIIDFILDPFRKLQEGGLKL